MWEVLEGQEGETQPAIALSGLREDVSPGVRASSLNLQMLARRALGAAEAFSLPFPRS